MASETLAARQPVIGIYVHIPFCRTICPYCDFLRHHLKEAAPEPFLEALCREIHGSEGPDGAETVFLGGGTPSLLSPQALSRVLTGLRERFKLVAPEITIEANPDDVTPELADAWAGLGVNRVSLGVQSFDDKTLQYLGRRHDAAGACRACAVVADRFDNWGMDLIFGAPPLASWRSTLEHSTSFEPKHVSTYGLTYEPGTPFGDRSHEEVDDDTYLDLYRMAEECLGDLDRYEIANFAQPGYECRHNLIYWRNQEYVGFGPGAYSYLKGVRSCNVTSLEAYMADPRAKDQVCELTERQIMTETLIQHFRLKRGLNKREYLRLFRRCVRDDYGPQLDSLIAQGLLKEDEETVRPTDKGFQLNNEIGLALVDALP